MKVYTPDNVRNVVLAGQSGGGKTTLADGMLFVSGAVSRFGKVADGSSVFDFELEEHARRSTVFATAGFAEWRSHRITILDTPGFADFFGSVSGPLNVAEGVALVISAVDGLEVQAERAWEMARKKGLAGLTFVNRMDVDRADFASHFDSIRQRLHITPVALYIPIGASETFQGIIDVLRGKALKFDANGKPQEEEIPADCQAACEAARDSLAEAAAEGSDELLEKYLDGETLSEQEILSGMRTAIQEGKVMPVLCGAADKGIGVSCFMDAVIDFFPNPNQLPPVEGHKANSEEAISVERSTTGPLAALVFKTVADPYVGRMTYLRVFSGTAKSDSEVFNAKAGQKERIGQLFQMQGKENNPVASASAGDIVAVAKLEHTNTGQTLTSEAPGLILDPPTYPRPSMWLAVRPKTRTDEDKMGSGLRRLVEEEPSLQHYREHETGETILAGLGDVHLHSAIDRMKRKFGVELETATPRIPYKETIRSKATAEGKHKKQSGGAGQFGVAEIEVEPLPRGAGFEFVDAIVGGAISGKYIPSVEKGIRDRMARGGVSGYQLTDFRVRLCDGKEHPVDSNDISFQMAGRLALETAVPQASPYLVEPIMDVDITIPDDNIGDVIGDLNSRRGRVLGTEPLGGTQVVKAQVPLSEMYRYSADLRSMSRGRGSFQMEFSHYEEVPAHLAEQIIAESKKDKDSS